MAWIVSDFSHCGAVTSRNFSRGNCRRPASNRRPLGSRALYSHRLGTRASPFGSVLYVAVGWIAEAAGGANQLSPISRTQLSFRFFGQLHQPASRVESTQLGPRISWTIRALFIRRETAERTAPKIEDFNRANLCGIHSRRSRQLRDSDASRHWSVGERCQRITSECLPNQRTQILVHDSHSEGSIQKGDCNLAEAQRGLTCFFPKRLKF